MDMSNNKALNDFQLWAGELSDLYEVTTPLKLEGVINPSLYLLNNKHEEKSYFDLFNLNSSFYFDFTKDTDSISKSILKGKIDINANKEFSDKVKELSRELEAELSKINDEEDSYYSSEKKFDEILRNFPALAGNVLQSVYLKKTDNVKFMLGICNILKEYDYDDVKPWGPVTILGLVNNKSDEVKEAVISVIDNWESPEMIPSLKSIECKKEWMQRYIDKVIKRLQK